MDLCRICLTSNAEKDISDLETCKRGENTTYTQVLMFCLNIQVTQDIKTTRKICKKCFNKTIRYYEFKTLALQSDAYLESLTSRATVKLEVLIKADECDSNLDNNTNNQDTNMINLKEKECEEPKVKHESSSNGVRLSDMKHKGAEVVNALENRQYQITKMKRSKVTLQECKKCGKIVKNIKEHMKVHVSQPEVLTLKCDICRKGFNTKSALMKHHRLQHYLDVSECCDICNKVVKNLKVHQRIAHNKSSLRHICSYCDKRFISRSVLNTHMLTHVVDRPFECDLCASKFKQKILLAEHIRQVHNKERPHLCQFCSKSFYKGHHLKVHIRTHTKEKPYKCDKCGRSFRSIPALNKHKMVHSDSKNYACTLCHKTFARNCYLTHHMLSHTKEKRHACKYCGAMFGRSDNRKRHEYVTHERHQSDYDAVSKLMTYSDEANLKPT